MSRFFPVGSASCIVNKCVSFGVYESYCCVPDLRDCCGEISIFGWILVGALIILISGGIILIVKKKCIK
ncbi:hypothetical protein V3C99_003375 [Haemonchus contortus]